MTEPSPAGAIQDPAALCKGIIGRRFPGAQAVVQKDHARAFCEAIGETNPLYLDSAFARSEGYRDILVPPTYLFVVKFSVMNPANVLHELGLEGSAGKLLHAEQSFEYLVPVCAGDRLDFEEQVADAYDKRNGALLFVALETRVTNQLQEHVLSIRHTEVVRMDA